MSAVGESDEWNVTRQDKNVIWIWVEEKKKQLGFSYPSWISATWHKAQHQAQA